MVVEKVLEGGPEMKTIRKIIGWFRSLSTAKIKSWWKNLEFWQKAFIILGGLLALISVIALAASS